MISLNLYLKRYRIQLFYCNFTAKFETMFKNLFYIFIIGVLVGCKSQKILPTETKIDTSLQNREIIDKHHAASPKFETLSGSLSVFYDNGKQQQNLPFSLRMKKGEAILLSAPLGIAKAFLTPQKVQFYNKLDSSYFDGDYSIAEQLIGVKLEYKMIENLLLGELLLPAEGYDFASEAEGYTYTTQKVASYAMQGILNSLFRVGTTQIASEEENLTANVSYSYQEVQSQVFPSEISLESTSYSRRMTLKMSFNNLEINPQLNFPFKIPSGYKPLMK